MTHASVFSGIGGPEVAAAMLGWENLFHCEINPFGRQVLHYWFPNGKSYEDITTTDFTEWHGRVDVLTGGFPCQPFSYAGQRRGEADDRYLWPHMFRCIDEVRPTWVVAENVAGILTMVEQGEVTEVAGQGTLFDEGDNVRRYQLRETFTLQRICDDLEGHGYSVQPILIPACAVGAPHRRDRVFIVARRQSASNANGAGQPASDESSGRKRATVDGKREDIALNGVERPCPPQAAADTRHAGLQEARAEQPTAGDRRHGVWLGEWVKGQQDDGIAGCGRWRDFPTQSPVHRGNDGLPFRMDGAAFSFDIDDKDPLVFWRTEALKAHGNAIVPQVIYEIFKAIEITENNKQS